MATLASTLFRDDFSADGLRRSASEARKYAKILIPLSLLMIALGLYAITHFAIATVASMFVLGAVLVGGGILHAIDAFQVRRWNIALLNVMVATLYIVTGVIAFREPVSAAIAVSLVLGAFYIMSGISRIVGSLAIKPMHWGWMLLHGLTTFALGLLILATWPLTALWVVGLIVGIDLVMSGAMILGASLMIRKALKEVAAPTHIRSAA